MAVVVTTPQEVALLDCARAITMARKMEIKDIGVIENMSELVCPECGTHIDLFGSGGGKRLAERMQVRFLGTLPFDLETRESSDEGRPIVLHHPLNEVSMSIIYIAREMQAVLQEEQDELVE
jgi:ATP-binding protein involved in chromosome partitioning